MCPAFLFPDQSTQGIPLHVHKTYACTPEDIVDLNDGQLGIKKRVQCIVQPGAPHMSNLGGSHWSSCTSSESCHRLSAVWCACNGWPLPHSFINPLAGEIYPQNKKGLSHSCYVPWNKIKHSVLMVLTKKNEHETSQTISVALSLALQTPAHNFWNLTKIVHTASIIACSVACSKRCKTSERPASQHPNQSDDGCSFCPTNHYLSALGHQVVLQMVEVQLVLRVWAGFDHGLLSAQNNRAQMACLRAFSGLFCVLALTRHVRK